MRWQGGDARRGETRREEVDSSLIPCFSLAERGAVLFLVKRKSTAFTKYHHFTPHILRHCIIGRAASRPLPPHHPTTQTYPSSSTPSAPPPPLHLRLSRDDTNHPHLSKEERSRVNSTAKPVPDNPQKETSPRGTDIKHHQFSAHPCRAWPRKGESDCQIELRRGFKQTHTGNKRSRR